MSKPGVNLTNCDLEPIHIPGRIQSYGFLIVIDKTHVTVFHSANIGSFIPGFSGNLLGKHINYIESLIGSTVQQGFITQLLNLGTANKSFEQFNPFKINISGAFFHLIISTADNYYLLEFEPALEESDIQRMIGRSVSEMLADTNLQKMLYQTAIEVKRIIHYDRVMIYRFAEDGHGEVVAEAANTDLVSWLGLHYPASDIPKQARELYKLNLTRLIADVNSEPSDIITTADNLHPLDLTNAQLRAVSPVHIQYMKNMKVASSFSISLLYKKELWGLIACHNYTPRFIEYKDRKSSELIGQILASALEYRLEEKNLQTREFYHDKLEKLSKNLSGQDSVQEALTAGPVNIMDVVNASGAVLMYENKMIKLGSTPDDEQLRQLINWTKANKEDTIFYTSRLSEIYEGASAYKSVASGMLVLELSANMEEFIVWFKPEIIQTISWAGNPQKPVETTSSGLTQLSPRHSFEVWSQETSGTSDSWNAEEIKVVLQVKEEIAYANNLKKGALLLLNEKLRTAYDELDTFSYTISHDLKSPITAIKGYAQILAADDSIQMSGQKILFRINELTDKMHFMINEVLNYSRIGRLAIQRKKITTSVLINDIIKELQQVHDTSLLNITIGGTPDLFGDSVMIMQLFSNLIGNAVKYSQQANPPTIHIDGVSNEIHTCYSVCDNGIGMANEDIPKIFDLFHRNANVKNIEGSGVGLAIAKRIVEKHSGQIWVKSEPEKGSTFFVSFKN
jgi:chemotaxis family two-component system sensor kinase Cph1